MNRRDFTKLAGAAALAPRAILTGRETQPLMAPSIPWPGYDRAIAIDCLASPGPFNTPDRTGDPLTSPMVANAKSSGITAVNVTIGGDTFGDTFRDMGYWERELQSHPDVFSKIYSVADIRRAKETRRLGLIYGFQNATMLEGDPANLDVFHRFGVRIIQLTYNDRNLLGDGCLEPANAGLSKHGRDVVAHMNELRMIVDLSHCGLQTTSDGIVHSTRPVAITHSGCRGVFDHPRSKTDAILKALAAKGGVLGIYMMPFINAQGQPRAADLVRQIEYAVNVCGEDHVGIGSDLSITPHVVNAEYEAKHRRFVEARKARGIAAPREEDFMFVKDLNTPRRLEQIAELLLARKHSEARVEKIVGGNWLRLFGDVWGG
jgi:membrane dipeptidase